VEVSWKGGRVEGKQNTCYRGTLLKSKHYHTPAFLSPAINLYCCPFFLTPSLLPPGWKDKEELPP
jgi:hypothetical protein